MKRFLFMLMLLGVMVFAVACSSDNDDSASKGGSDGEDDEVYTIRWAMSVPETHASSVALHEIKDSITEESDGRIVIEVYENGQLYPSDREAVEAVQIGNLEATGVATPTLATFHERFSIFDLPFLFDNREDAYAAMDGELGATLEEEMLNINLQSLGFGENGFRHILNNKGPIEHPEDMKGMKFRVMENKVYENMFNELGANSSPLSFGELYTALQQGVYDGMDNPISLVYTMKFNEVQDYMTLSGHTFAPIISMINKDYFDAMPEDLQKILVDGTERFSQRQREITAQQDEEYLEELKNDMEINELTAEQKAEFVEALAPIYEQYKDVVGEDLLEMVGVN